MNLWYKYCCLFCFLLFCSKGQSIVLGAGETYATSFQQQRVNKLQTSSEQTDLRVNNTVNNQKGKIEQSQYQQLYRIEKALIDAKELSQLPLSSFKRLFLLHLQAQQNVVKTQALCMWETFIEITKQQPAEAAAVASYLLSGGLQQEIEQQQIAKQYLEQSKVIVMQFKARAAKCNNVVAQ